MSDHRFLRHPHSTVLGLSLPILLALIAEPLTGIADTAFVARLGAQPVAGLGVATVLLASVLWVFNFLAIGTQTEVSVALGSGQPTRAAATAGVAIRLSLMLGCALIVLGWPLAPYLCRLAGAQDGVLADAVVYLRIRLFGAPAGLAALAAFGALRGAQDMRTPLWVSLVLHGTNIGLDAVLILGPGPAPALGLAGAALATVLAQWTGALLALRVLAVRLGVRLDGGLAGAGRLVVVGRDLFARTALLLLFTLAATRAATRAGVHVAAAHQGTRQIWMFSAFVLDALGATAQSLVGFFRGAGRNDLARRAAAVCCGWGLAAGLVLTLLLLGAESPAARLLVPPSARDVFATAWILVAISQPFNAVSFVTDGVHWGSGDYRYLRNAMLMSTGIGLIALAAVDLASPLALRWIWAATLLWMVVRCAAGLVRIWPGSAAAPLGRTAIDSRA
ncbi:MAG: MATE family efflux transporter [Thermoanaerobaculia bacterium]|nr:MATE family efflux transporter [Thermoanaerobaculia bacterium]